MSVFKAMPELRHEDFGLHPKEETQASKKGRKGAEIKKGYPD